MFADYRVPQTLVHFGAMAYDETLTQKLREGALAKEVEQDVHESPFSDTVFEVGSAEEVEIRGASIYVVEELKKLVIDELKTKHPEVPLSHVNSILLDHFLWDYRRRHAQALEHIPFHKTIGIYY